MPDPFKVKVQHPPGPEGAANETTWRPAPRFVREKPITGGARKQVLRTIRILPQRLIRPNRQERIGTGIGGSVL